MTPDLSIIIPTVSGREPHLERCIDTYTTTASADGFTVEVLTYLNRPGVAYGWQLGAEAARGQYVAFTCDDIEARPGWAAAAAVCVEYGNQPAPRLFNTDGTTWKGEDAYDAHTLPDRTPVPFSGLPFILRDWWPDVTPLPPGLHYFSDNWIAYRLHKAGIATVACRGYDFTHSWAEEHRGAGFPKNDRGAVDSAYFQQALDIIAQGEAGFQ